MPFPYNGVPRISLVGMGVAPIPILGLLFSARLLEVAVPLVVFCKIAIPGVSFVAIPLMVVLVVAIVDPLFVVTVTVVILILGGSSGCQRYWRRKYGCQT
jgi:hypothetical protein